MREQLISYVELLFAGCTEVDDMKQEILQNTLERYDDLIEQGKSPEAAYRLAISGIGDISELLGADTSSVTPVPSFAVPAPVKKKDCSIWKRFMKAFAIFLYIISPIPLFVLSMLNMEEIGLCGTLAICGVATALLIIAGSTAVQKEEKKAKPSDEQEEKNPLLKAINTLVTTVGIIAYFIISFWSGAWLITWVIFPLIGAVKGLAKAVFDLLEVEK